MTTVILFPLERLKFNMFCNNHGIYYLEEACISLMVHHISAQYTVHYATMRVVVHL
jgi:hypothetical protein